MSKNPSIDRLFELFYIPDNGFLYRKVERSSDIPRMKYVGEDQDQDGYFTCKMDDKSTRVHVVVFAMMHGRWPDGEIDHANGIKNDNRPENLREATRVQNMHNRPKQRNSVSGIRGVHWNKQCKKWHAQIMVNRKVHYLGLYDDIEDARMAYVEASRKFLGEFSRS